MVLALCGPSQIGKTYAKEAILGNRKDVKELHWYTTKPLGPDETVGRHLTAEQFKRNSDSGKLVAVYEENGYLYGFSKQDIVSQDTLFITELLPSKALDLKNINPDIVAISLVTDSGPSGLDILRERMGRKYPSKSELEKNLKIAKTELEIARENYNYFDAAVLVTRKNQKTFRNTIVLLANTLAP